MGAIGGIVGGIFGQQQAAGDVGQARDAQTNAYNIMQNLAQVPDIQKPIILQQYKQAGIYTPEVEQLLKAQDPSIVKYSQQADTRIAQQTALSQIQQRAVGGLSAADRAALAQAQQAAQGDVQSRIASIQQQMQQRGQAGGGADLAAQLAAAQSGASTEAQNALNVAQMSEQARIQAAAQLGQLGAQQEAQQFGEAAQKSQAQSEMDRFNVQNQIGQQARNVQAQNQAQLYNLGTAQQLANMNVAQQNQELQAQRQRAMQQWGAQVGRSEAQAGSAQQFGNYLGQQAQATKQGAIQTGTGIGNIIGDVGSALMFNEGGQIKDYREGGAVPGKAKVPGDSPLNDTVNAKVSPGEIVLPRTIAQLLLKKSGKDLHKEVQKHVPPFIQKIQQDKQSKQNFDEGGVSGIWDKVKDAVSGPSIEEGIAKAGPGRNEDLSRYAGKSSDDSDSSNYADGGVTNALGSADMASQLGQMDVGGSQGPLTAPNTPKTIADYIKLFNTPSSSQQPSPEDKQKQQESAPQNPFSTLSQFDPWSARLQKFYDGGITKNSDTNEQEEPGSDVLKNISKYIRQKLNTPEEPPKKTDEEERQERYQKIREENRKQFTSDPMDKEGYALGGSISPARLQMYQPYVNRILGKPQPMMQQKPMQRFPDGGEVDSDISPTGGVVTERDEEGNPKTMVWSEQPEQAPEPIKIEADDSDKKQPIPVDFEEPSYVKAKNPKIDLPDLSKGEEGPESPEMEEEKSPEDKELEQEYTKEDIEAQEKADREGKEPSTKEEIDQELAKEERPEDVHQNVDDAIKQTFTDAKDEQDKERVPSSEQVAPVTPPIIPSQQATTQAPGQAPAPAQGGILAELQKAQQQRKLGMLMSNLDRSGHLIATGMNKIAPFIPDEYFQGPEKMGQLGIQNLQEKLAVEEYDPNSSVSSAYRALFKQITGQDPNPNWSGHDLKQINPVLTSIVNKKQAMLLKGQQLQLEEQRINNQAAYQMTMAKTAQERNAINAERNRQLAQLRTTQQQEKQKEAYNKIPVEVSRDVQKVFSRGAIAKAKVAEVAADRALELLKTFGDPAGWKGPETKMLDAELATVLKGGSASPSTEDRKDLSNPTLVSKWAELVSKIENKPIGMSQGEFIKRKIAYIKDLKALTHGIVSDSITSAVNAHKKRLQPDDFQEMINSDPNIKAYYRDLPSPIPSPTAPTSSPQPQTPRITPVPSTPATPQAPKGAFGLHKPGDRITIKNKGDFIVGPDGNSLIPAGNK